MRDAKAKNGKITGRGRARIPRPPDDGSPMLEPLPMGGVRALCLGQRPFTIVDSGQVYDINESAESII